MANTRTVPSRFRIATLSGKRYKYFSGIAQHGVIGIDSPATKADHRRCAQQGSPFPLVFSLLDFVSSFAFLFLISLGRLLGGSYVMRLFERLMEEWRASKEGYKCSKV